MSKLLIVRAVCTADVHETWTYRVPDDWEPPAPIPVEADILGLSPGDRARWAQAVADGPPPGAEHVSVINAKVENEEDRELTEIDLVPEPQFAAPTPKVDPSIDVRTYPSAGGDGALVLQIDTSGDDPRGDDPERWLRINVNDGTVWGVPYGGEPTASRPRTWRGSHDGQQVAIELWPDGELTIISRADPHDMWSPPTTLQQDVAS